MWEVILIIGGFGLTIVALLRAKRRGSLPRQGSARLEDVAHIRGGHDYTEGGGGDSGDADGD
jgi:hypothetical protein